MDASKIYQVAITLVPGIGNMLARQLTTYCGSAREVFSANKKKLTQIPGIGQKIANSIHSHSVLWKAEQVISKCEKDKIRILHYTDEQYPWRLKQLYDSPVILYFKGNADLNPTKAISIVGTRRISSYGQRITEQIVSDLRKHNATIISGLAYGVDHLAHTQALRIGLPTIGVIAGGMDNIYPALHIKTANRMLYQGGIIAENEPEIVPEAHFFPERNRIIAGLSDGVIIVEAAKKGGALITAEFANNYNREVFAVPGQIGQYYSTGCNNLIKSHKASIYTSISDVEYILNWDPVEPKTEGNIKIPTDLSIPEKKIIGVLQQNFDGILIDDLSWKSQIPLNQIASHLLNLEFRGYVKALPGKKFILKK
jgi:DNA processing protein